MYSIYCRPLEIPSKKPVDIKVPSKKPPASRDPRFDDISGEYNEQLFKRSYRFIDKIKKKEYKVSVVVEGTATNISPRLQIPDHQDSYLFVQYARLMN